ncbi:MAG: TRAP transporter substrate-binding protein [Deltaproteobacteria bacterium]|nr:TRAP transporter substrate-binding protein [Deltaproteobacteria bacterium]
MKRIAIFSLPLLIGVLMVLTATAGAEEKKDPLAAWKPKFDPSQAQYTYLVSNVSHPVIEGVGAGYRIRDAVWERSGGRLFVDFRPLSQLGGEKDVLNKLKMGAIQGMLCSSVVAANVSDVLGIVNVPYVVNTFDKLDKFRADPALFDPFKNSAQAKGILVVDITGYGTYGWATTTPVANLKDAQKVNFRIAEAPVNADIYKAWGLKFTVMPWPDVPQALQTGVITGLDHTPIVCNITKKFEVAKYFTEVDYAQGLFIHLMNKRWFDKLPADLQKILVETIAEESAKTREATKRQQLDQIAAAKAKGIQFFPLSATDQKALLGKSAPVIQEWRARIGADYFDKVKQALGD